MGVTAGICRSFLYGLNRTETVGLERFLELLDGRKDIESRERGLLTGMTTVERGSVTRLTSYQFRTTSVCTFRLSSLRLATREKKLMIKQNR